MNYSELPQSYWAKVAYKTAILLLIIGGLNWGYSAVRGIDFVTQIFGRSSNITRIIFFFVGFAALAVMFHRDTYLPFLGETVMPCSVVEERTPKDADTTVTVKVAPGAKVVYWAAEPANDVLKTLNGPFEAYLKYDNAGVAIAGEDGTAVLRVRKPQAYVVPMRGRLDPHVHYRVCQSGYGNDGILGRIKTVYVKTGAVEGFEDMMEMGMPMMSSQEMVPVQQSEGFYTEDSQKVKHQPPELMDRGFMRSGNLFMKPGQVVVNETGIVRKPVGTQYTADEPTGDPELVQPKPISQDTWTGASEYPYGGMGTPLSMAF